MDLQKIIESFDDKTRTPGVDIFSIGEGRENTVLEIGSKPSISTYELKNILTKSTVLFVPSELKSKGETASNFRSTDIRFDTSVETTPDKPKQTSENKLIMDNILYLFNESQLPYYQTALPREARPLSMNVKKFVNNEEEFIEVKTDSEMNKRVSDCVRAFLTRNGVTSEKYGKLFIKSTKGAYNKTFLADVFSMLEGINMLSNNEFETKGFSPEISYFETNARDPHTDKKTDKKIFCSCIHFKSGGRDVRSISSKNIQSRLLKEFMCCMSNKDNKVKRRISEFFSKNRLIRTTDMFVNDIDDFFILLILKNCGVSIHEYKNESDPCTIM